MRPREYSLATILDEKDPEELRNMLIRLMSLYLTTLAEFRISNQTTKEMEQ